MSAACPNAVAVTQDDRYVVLFSHSWFAYLTDPDLLFEGGVTRCCGRPVGPRTDHTLGIHMELAPPLAYAKQGGPSYYILVIREETALLLRSLGLKESHVRPALRPGRTRVKYLELLPSFVPETVAQIGLRNCGQKCTVCQRVNIHSDSSKFHSRELVRADDIPLGQSLFWVGTRPSSLCVRRDWWKANRARPECRGIVAQPLWVVRHDDIDVSPSFKVEEPKRDAHEVFMLEQGFFHAYRSQFL